MTILSTLPPTTRRTRIQQQMSPGLARPMMLGMGNDTVHFSGAKTTATKLGIAIVAGAVSEWFVPSIIQNFVNPAVAFLTFGGLSLFGWGKNDGAAEAKSPDAE